MAELATKRRRTTFYFDAPEAEAVCLVGSFNEWSTKKHPMKRGEHGTWTASLLLLPGTYEYRLLVDGRWADDPTADRHVPNEFGSTNAIRSIAP